MEPRSKKYKKIPLHFAGTTHLAFASKNKTR